MRITQWFKRAFAPWDDGPSIAKMMQEISQQYATAGRYDSEDLYYPSKSLIREAEEVVTARMRRDGWTWLEGRRDCDNLAQKMAIELQHYIATFESASKGKSIAIGVKIVDQGKHMICVAYYDVGKYLEIDYTYKKP